MRASRLVSILLLLQARGRMTAQSLADEFEVSVRTIYRDIDDLSASGVPVYADRGRDGGFQLLEGYTTRLTGMTPAEAESLFLSGLEGPAMELGLGESTAAARLKLLAALPSARRADASRVAMQQLISSIIRTSTQEQKTHAHNKLQDWIDDCRYFIARK